MRNLSWPWVMIALVTTWCTAVHSCLRCQHRCLSLWWFYSRVAWETLAKKKVSIKDFIVTEHSTLGYSQCFCSWAYGSGGMLCVCYCQCPNHPSLHSPTILGHQATPTCTTGALVEQKSVSVYQCILQFDALKSKSFWWVGWYGASHLIHFWQGHVL